MKSFFKCLFWAYQIIGLAFAIYNWELFVNTFSLVYSSLVK